MASFEGIGNLRQSGIRPLKSTARPQPQESVLVSAKGFPGENIKKGAETFKLDSRSMNQTTTPEGGNQNEQKSASLTILRNQSLRKGSKDGEGSASASASASSLSSSLSPSLSSSLSPGLAKDSQLSPEEQVAKLKKIREAAVKYEAVFLDHMVKQMRPDPLTKTAGGDILSDIAQQPFRDFMSQAGGLGLAGTIVSQVALQEGLDQTLQENPGIMGPGWKPSTHPNHMTKPAGNLQFKGQSLEKTSLTAPITTETTQIAQSSSQKTGLMSHEEIAYLYKDASLGAS